MKFVYRLLNYVHDTISQESTVVGIIFYSQEAGFLEFSYRNDLKPLKHIIENFNPKNLSSTLKFIENSVQSYSRRIKQELPINNQIANFIDRLLPCDASSLQWGHSGSGFNENLRHMYNYYTERFLPTHAKNAATKTRSDESVWAVFKKELQQHNLLTAFTPRNVPLGKLHEQLEYTYQNGALHCLKPLSLDLTTEEGLMEKVYRMKGWHSSIEQSNPDKSFKFYFLVGQPSKHEFSSAYVTACNLLQDDTSVIIPEDNPSNLSRMLQNIIHH